VVDLAGWLADVIERIATAEALAAEDIADILRFGEDSAPDTAPGVAAPRGVPRQRGDVR
jgi:hypothetical protein